MSFALNPKTAWFWQVSHVATAVLESALRGLQQALKNTLTLWRIQSGSHLRWIESERLQMARWSGHCRNGSRQLVCWVTCLQLHKMHSNGFCTCLRYLSILGLDMSWQLFDLRFLPPEIWGVKVTHQDFDEDWLQALQFFVLFYHFFTYTIIIYKFFHFLISDDLRISKSQGMYQIGEYRSCRRSRRSHCESVRVYESNMRKQRLQVRRKTSQNIDPYDPCIIQLLSI